MDRFSDFSLEKKLKKTIVVIAIVKNNGNDVFFIFKIDFYNF